MNCFALIDATLLVICRVAIWFTFILMCLWHQENSWDSRRNCLCFGVQPELRLFMFSNQRTTSLLSRECLKIFMGLKCHSHQDFVKLGSMFCISQPNTAVSGFVPSCGGSGFYFSQIYGIKCSVFHRFYAAVGLLPKEQNKADEKRGCIEHYLYMRVICQCIIATAYLFNQL